MEENSMKNFNKFAMKGIIGGLICSFFMSIQISPTFASTTYNLDLSKTYSSGPGAITRGDGFLFFSNGNTFRQVKESNGFLNPNTLSITPVGSTTSPIVKMAFLNSTIFVLREDGTLDKGTPDSVGTGSVGLPFTFGTVCTGSTAEKANDMISDSNYILVTCKSDRTIHLFDEMSELGAASTSWTPGRSTLADGYAYVANLDSTDVKRFSVAGLDGGVYYPGPTALALPVTSINVGTDIASNSSELQITSDSQYVWVTSGINTHVIKVSRIKKSDNSVASINLTGYTVNTNTSNYQVGGISSDGSNLFVSLYQQPTILAVNITDSTFTAVAAPSMDIRAIQAVTGGFWVSGATAALKYLAHAVTNTDSSAEASKKRQAAIDSARNALVAKIKAGETIVNSDFIAADVTQFNSDLAKRANAEFQVAAKSKSFSFADVKTIINKWTIYQDIQHGVRSNVTGRLAYQAGIIPSSVKMKQTLIAQVMNTDASERSSVEKIDALIAELAKKQSDQENRKVTIINKITSRK